MCRILCEGLESMDGIVDAVECFYRMSGELMEEGLTHDEAEWVRGKQSEIVLVAFMNICL